MNSRRGHTEDGAAGVAAVAAERALFLQPHTRSDSTMRGHYPWHRRSDRPGRESGRPYSALLPPSGIHVAGRVTTSTTCTTSVTATPFFPVGHTSTPACHFPLRELRRPGLCRGETGGQIALRDDRPQPRWTTSVSAAHSRVCNVILCIGLTPIVVNATTTATSTLWPSGWRCRERWCASVASHGPFVAARLVLSAAGRCRTMKSSRQGSARDTG
jgi:hypothetical protein